MNKQAELMQMKSYLEAKAQGQLGGLQIVTAEKYVRRIISFSAKEPMIKNSTDASPGISSFQGDKLEKGNWFLFNGIKIGYSNHADATEIAKLTYSTTPPADFLGADLIISQKGKVLLNLPVSGIVNPNAGATIEDEYKKVSYTVFEPNAPISAEFHFPDGSSAPANSNYIHLAFAGVETIPA